MTRRDAAQTELHGDPQALNAIGRAVEAAGYDYLLMFDHVACASAEALGPRGQEFSAGLFTCCHISRLAVMVSTALS